MTRHCAISVDTAGLEPAASHCVDTVVDAGALPFKSYASCDSFLAGESDPVVGGRTPFCWRGVSGFEVAQTPTAKEEGIRRSCLRTGGTPDPYRRSCRSCTRETSCRFPGKTGTPLCPCIPCCYMVYMTWGFHPLSAASCGKRKRA